MPKSGKLLYYWDTCSFISWLKGGSDCSQETMDGLNYIARQVNDNKAFLCTSVTTQSEVLEGKFTQEQNEKLEKFFRRRNVLLIAVDTKIAQRASEIRNYYSLRGTKIATPDATHLATAIIYKVDEFHTRDGDGKQRANDLLRLNGDVAGYPLLIRVPTAPVGPLLEGVGALPPQAIEENDENQNTQHASTEVRGSDNGHPEDQARTKAISNAVRQEASEGKS